MEIKGNQIRKMVDLMPEEKREKFKEIFRAAFTKSDISKDIEIKLLEYAGEWRGIEILRKTADPEIKKRICILDLNGARFRELSEKYEIALTDGGAFRVLELAE